MSEHIAAEIRIGGSLPRRLVTKFCEEIQVSGVAPEWGAGPFEPNSAQDLLDEREEIDGVQVLRFYDAEARWGEFESLEVFLERHRMPFDRFSEPKYEYDAQWLAFRPGSKPRFIRINAERSPVVLAAGLTRAWRQLSIAVLEFDKRRTQPGIRATRSALRLFDRAMPAVVDPLPPFEIAG